MDWSRCLTTHVLSPSVSCGLDQPLEHSHPLVCTLHFCLPCIVIITCTYLPHPLSLSFSLSFSFALSLSVGPTIDTGPVDQELEAGERLALNCTGVNNPDATMPLRVNWFLTSFDSQFPQDLYNISDPRVVEIRMPDNITVMSFFVIDPVMASDAGVYGCQVSNRDGILPIERNATVNVLCECCTSGVATV